MKTIRFISAVILMAVSSALYAEDIDIFLNNPNASAGNPNVLLILDNTTNWSSNLDGETRFAREVAALQAVVDTLDANINLGLMMMHEDGNGGYVRYGARPMNDYNKKSLKEVLGKLIINQDATAQGNGKYGTMMFEAYKYFGGGGTSSDTTPSPEGPSAHGPVLYQGGAPTKKSTDDKRSFVFNPHYLGYSFPQQASGSALLSKISSKYQPLVTDTCSKNFIIIISNGLPPKNVENEMAGIINGLGGNATPIPLKNSKAQTTFSDEMARFLANNDVSPIPGDQFVTTYSLAVYEAGTENKPAVAGAIELMASTARQGKGEFFPATDATQLAEALESIFNQIQAVDSVFASVTLPVSVNVRGTHLNQVYMGVFRPNENDNARWLGNLKQYKVAETDEAGVFLADASGNPVQNPATGFVRDTAESFWTVDSDFWSFSPSGEPPSASDLPDGPLVEKGGAAQQIRTQFPSSQASRQVYTGNMISFDTTTFNPSKPSVQALLGAADASEAEAIINWARGQDNKDENGNGVFTDIRPSVHGDVLHSQPAVINFSDDPDDVMVFYGSNDGALRAIQGGRGNNGGQEHWSYIATEFLPKLKKIRDNNVPRSAVNPKPYFFDGPITQFQHDGRRYLYVTARRGGRLIYAFDITNPTSPSLLWRKTNTQLPELGQTWSAPSPTILNLNNVATPVIVMGAGYDPNQDRHSPGNDTMGRGIFILDALTGDAIAQFGPGDHSDLRFSIPASVTVFDSDRDGFSDRIYVGDTGGQVWRADISALKPEEWKIHKLAELGITAPFAGSADRRKFLFAPDVVSGTDDLGSYYAILIGTGDREKPFEESVENHFYLIKDRSDLLYSGPTDLRLSHLYDATANLIQFGTETEQKDAELGLRVGGYIRLQKGEKVTTKAITVSGFSYFNTNQPSSAAANSCNANLGVARQYVIAFDTLGIPESILNSSNNFSIDDRFDELAGGGFAPTPTAIRVLGKELITTGVNVRKAQKSLLNARFRVFWYEVFE